MNLKTAESGKPISRILPSETPRYFKGVKSRLDTTTVRFEKRVKPETLLKFKSGSDLHIRRVSRSDKTDVNVSVKIPFKGDSKLKPPIYKPNSKPKIVCSARITVRLGILNRRL